MSEPTYQLRQALVQQLESLQRAGVMQMAKTRTKAQPARATKAAVSSPEASPATAVKQETAPAEAPPVEPTSSGRSLKPGSPDMLKELAVLREEVAGCTACGELAGTRTQTVFGVGNPKPRLCFLGEAPGADEDKQGEPFVGKAGQLLNKIIDACQMNREDVYILNILKCRPPGNRTPLPQEAANCRGYLNRQLELLQPEFICCLGACAAHNLLQTDTPIGKMRNKFHDYQGIKVMCTYHPAYLLRNPDAKKHVWEDMKKLMREMGTPID